MIAKMLNGIAGYGRTNLDALNACRGMSLLSNIQNIHKYEDLLLLRRHYAPWFPTPLTLHINDVGYFTKESLRNVDSLFSFCYNVLKKLSFIECMTIIPEVVEFLNLNNIRCSVEDYNIISPGINALYDPNMSHYLNIGEYSIAVFTNNTVGLKKHFDETQWLCSYNGLDNMKDILYYIAKFASYSDFDKIFK